MLTLPARAGVAQGVPPLPTSPPISGGEETEHSAAKGFLNLIFLNLEDSSGDLRFRLPFPRKSGERGGDGGQRIEPLCAPEIPFATPSRRGREQAVRLVRDFPGPPPMRGCRVGGAGEAEAN